MIVLYLISIVIANLSVARFGPTVVIPNALILVAFDLVARDSLHETWQHNGLCWKMLALIGTGSAISALLNLNALRIAIASFIAFAGSGFVDFVIYSLAHRYQRITKSNLSNIGSAITDSLIFAGIAFGFPLLWWVILGQIVAKSFGGVFWSFLIFSNNRTGTARTIIRV